MNMFNGRREVSPEAILKEVASQVVADYRAVQNGMINPKMLGLSINKLENVLRGEL